jgi:hypothetical protein
MSESPETVFKFLNQKVFFKFKEKQITITYLNTEICTQLRFHLYLVDICAK